MLSTPRTPEYETTSEHKPTIHSRSKVIELACIGVKHPDIARYLSIELTTLEKYYPRELYDALNMRVAKLARNLYLDALSGDKKCRQFFLQTKGGFYYSVPPASDNAVDSITNLVKCVLEHDERVNSRDISDTKKQSKRDSKAATMTYPDDILTNRQIDDQSVYVTPKRPPPRFTGAL
jgi:hypothetical protein